MEMVSNRSLLDGHALVGALSDDIAFRPSLAFGDMGVIATWLSRQYGEISFSHTMPWLLVGLGC